MEALRDPYFENAVERASLITTTLRELEDTLGGPRPQAKQASLILAELTENAAAFALPAKHIKTLRQLRALADDLDVPPPSSSQQQNLTIHRDALADRPVSHQGKRIDAGSSHPHGGPAVLLPPHQAAAMFRAREAMTEFCALLPYLPPSSSDSAVDYFCAANIVERARQLLIGMRTDIDEYLQAKP